VLQAAAEAQAEQEQEQVQTKHQQLQQQSTKAAVAVVELTMVVDQAGGSGVVIVNEPSNRPNTGIKLLGFKTSI
jgi:hypothetical protein